MRYTWALVLYPTVMKEKEKNKKRQKQIIIKTCLRMIQPLERLPVTCMCYDLLCGNIRCTPPSDSSRKAGFKIQACISRLRTSAYLLTLQFKPSPSFSEVKFVSVLLTLYTCTRPSTRPYFHLETLNLSSIFPLPTKLSTRPTSFFPFPYPVKTRYVPAGHVSLCRLAICKIKSDQMVFDSDIWHFLSGRGTCPP